jgi:hypothetical protein
MSNPFECEIETCTAEDIRDLSSNLPRTYAPLYSVQPFDKVPWQFRDELIAFYCDLSEPRILDATVNEGRIWGRGKSRYKYVGMDIDPSVKPDVVGDNTAMPFGDDSWDVIVYDPPHTGEQGKSRFASVYGTGIGVAKNGGLAHTYLRSLERRSGSCDQRDFFLSSWLTAHTETSSNSPPQSFGWQPCNSDSNCRETIPCHGRTSLLTRNGRKQVILVKITAHLWRSGRK